MPELRWDGKYGADGSKTRPVRVALPFQDVETVNESAQERSLMLDLFARNEPGEWRNRLIWGDKKYVLPALREELGGTVDLIYLAPPFVVHYVKAVLDEVFGVGAFQREIVWRIGWVSGYKSVAKNWIRNHDTVLFYVRTPGTFTFNNLSGLDLRARCT